MARSEGFEPPTFGVEIRNSIQLSYERKMVGQDGFEPSTSVLSGLCANQLCHCPEIGAP